MSLRRIVASRRDGRTHAHTHPRARLACSACAPDRTARDGQPTAVQADADSDGDGDESARSPQQPEFVDPECEVPHARRAAAAQPLLMDGRHACTRRS